MKATRILSLLLAILMVVTLVAACKREEPDENPNQGNDPTPPPAEEKKVTLAEDGETEYVIVRDYKVDVDVINSVNTIVSLMKTWLGVEIEVRECFNDRPDEPSDVRAAKEILVGMTNREESQEISNMRANDYVMKLAGDKIVVGGPSALATKTAIADFTAMIYEQGDEYVVREANRGDESITLPSMIFRESDSVTVESTYSYSSCQMLDARMDSFVLIYPKRSSMSNECLTMAEELQTHIARETGYELSIYKDTRCQGDYEILIGDTLRTSENTVQQLGDDEYYIKLQKTENGAQFLILFGKNAYSAALDAFKREVMPIRSDGGALTLPDGYCCTNSKTLH